MTQTYKPHTINELTTLIYEDNLSHFEFMENMNGGDCDCILHNTMEIIMDYWGQDGPNEALDYAEEMEAMGLD